MALYIGGVAVDATAAEIDVLDGLDRGSIVYGNASSVTSILDNGTNGQYLTTDGDDISWGTASGGASDIGALDDVTMDIANFVDGILIQPDSDGSAPTTGTLSAATGNVGIGKGVFTALTEGTYNTALGYNSLAANTTGGSNVAVGYSALAANTTASWNIAVGLQALEDNTTGCCNTALGILALPDNTTGADNTALGYTTLYSNTEGVKNIAIGRQSLYYNITGSYNTASGYRSLRHNTEGGNNVAVGHGALYAVSTGDNNVGIGLDSGRSGSPGGQVTTADNQLCLGDENIANAHIQVDWTVASDQRDKTDFTALDLGLDFVNDLEPLTYKWDKRSKYGDKTADDYDLNAQTPDGTHKEDWLDIGFKAQEVEALEIAAGYDKDNKTNLTTTLSDDGKQYGLQYSKFVPILVKAIQELSAKVEALENA
jgi:hypothetical protein